MIDLSLLGTGLKVLVVFGLLFGTLALVARLHGSRLPLRIRPTGPAPSRPVVRVLHRQGLAKGAAVTVVQIADRTLVLGVTDHQVNLLTDVALPQAADDTDDDDADQLVVDLPPAGTPVREATPAWRELVEGLRERTVRR